MDARAAYGQYFISCWEQEENERQKDIFYEGAVHYTMLGIESDLSTPEIYQVLAKPEGACAPHSVEEAISRVLSVHPLTLTEKIYRLINLAIYCEAKAIPVLANSYRQKISTLLTDINLSTIDPADYYQACLYYLHLTSNINLLVSGDEAQKYRNIPYDHTIISLMKHLIHTHPTYLDPYIFWGNCFYYNHNYLSENPENPRDATSDHLFAADYFRLGLRYDLAKACCEQGLAVHLKPQWKTELSSRKTKLQFHASNQKDKRQADMYDDLIARQTVACSPFFTKETPPLLLSTEPVMVPTPTV